MSHRLITIDTGLVPGPGKEVPLLLARCLSGNEEIIALEEDCPGVLRDAGWRYIQLPDTTYGWVCPDHLRALRVAIGLEEKT